ncbi:MAG: hypothetical protein ACM3PP_08265, partial [Candidatus Saccharibacteria bacterium]
FLLTAYLLNGCAAAGKTQNNAQKPEQKTERKTERKTQSYNTKLAFSLPELYTGKAVNFPGDFAGKRSLVVFFSTG